MPKVTIKNLQSKAIHCKANSEKLIDILLSESEWMHACGMKGRCTTCAVQVISDPESLSPPNEIELKFMALGKLTKDMRLSCQAVLQGDVTIKVPDKNKLPHLTYND